MNIIKTSIVLSVLLSCYAGIASGKNEQDKQRQLLPSKSTTSALAPTASVPLAPVSLPTINTFDPNLSPALNIGELGSANDQQDPKASTPATTTTSSTPEPALIVEKSCSALDQLIAWNKDYPNPNWLKLSLNWAAKKIDPNTRETYVTATKTRELQDHLCAVIGGHTYVNYSTNEVFLQSLTKLLKRVVVANQIIFESIKAGNTQVVQKLITLSPFLLTSTMSDIATKFLEKYRSKLDEDRQQVLTALGKKNSLNEALVTPSETEISSKKNGSALDKLVTFANSKNDPQLWGQMSHWSGKRFDANGQENYVISTETLKMNRHVLRVLAEHNYVEYNSNNEFIITLGRLLERQMIANAMVLEAIKQKDIKTAKIIVKEVPFLLLSTFLDIARQMLEQYNNDLVIQRENVTEALSKR